MVASFHQHYSTYTLQTYHHQEHQFRSCPMQMTSPSHLQARVQPRNTYNHTYIKFLHGQNNLTLNPHKTTFTLFTPDPAEYKSNLDLQINNTALCMATHPKVLGLTLDPKLTYCTHSQHLSTSTQAYPTRVTALLARWTEKLAGGPQAGRSRYPY